MATQYRPLGGQMSERSHLQSRPEPEQQNWWRCFCFLPVCLVLVVFLSSLIRRDHIVPELPPTTLGPPPTTSCKTESCSAVEEIMDPSVDPCVDFYAFSCGRWRAKYPRDKRDEHWTNFVRLSRRNQEIIRASLEGNKKYPGKWMNKVRRYYAQCKQRDKEEIDTTRTFLADLMSDVTVNITNKTTLTQTLADVFTHFGGNLFFRLFIGINDNNSSEHIIKVEAPSFTFPDREHYVLANKSKAEANMQFGLDYINNIYNLLQPTQSPDLNKVKKILQLESNFSLIKLSPG